MTAKRLGGIALLAAGLLVACERWQINGLVVQRESSPLLQEAIGGATATLWCPSAIDGGLPHIWATAVSVKTGQFVMFHENEIGPTEDCKVTVHKTGFANRTYPIDSVCAKFKEDPRGIASEPADAGTTGGDELTVPRSSAETTAPKKVCVEAMVLAEMEKASAAPQDAGTTHDAGTDPDAGDPDAG